MDINEFSTCKTGVLQLSQKRLVTNIEFKIIDKLVKYKKNVIENSQLWI